MVLDQSPRLDLVFHALAHPARRAIIRQLSGGEQNLSELASPLKMTFPAATKHVRVLERAKLVRRRVVGREHICRLRAEPLKEATLWTEQFRQFWEARFEALDTLLEEMKAEETKAEKQSPARAPSRPSSRAPSRAAPGTTSHSPRQAAPSTSTPR